MNVMLKMMVNIPKERIFAVKLDGYVFAYENTI